MIELQELLSHKFICLSCNKTVETFMIGQTNPLDRSVPVVARCHGEVEHLTLTSEELQMLNSMPLAFLPLFSDREIIEVKCEQQ